jgi:hypothetical protein
MLTYAAQFEGVAVLNRNSLQVAIALLVYVALVAAHIGGLSALQFALFTAAVLSVGLVTAISIHTPEYIASSASTHGFPSIAESKLQLNSIQNELNELQVQMNRGLSSYNDNRKFDS